MVDVDLELYKIAFRNTENPMIITDENYIIRDANDACIDFTGYSRSELIGQPPIMLFADEDTYMEAIELLENNRPWQGYIQASTKDGDLIYGSGTAIPLFVDGEKRGYGGIFVDLTERRKYEQALEVIHRVLRHDIRNEMNVALGYLENIEEETTAVVDESIDSLKSVIQRLVRRSVKAREFEKLLYEGFDQPNRSVSVDTLLEEQVSRVRDRYPDSTFELDTIPPTSIIANDMIDKVIESLLENAVEHNPDPVTVEVSTVISDETVQIRIEDDGVGVPDPAKEQIFGREEEDDISHGEGFSLYYVDRVVNTLDGCVWVEDNEAGGATFIIEFPKA